MKKTSRILMALFAVVIGNLCSGQQNDLFGNYRLDPVTPATGPRSFSIGNTWNAGANAALLNVRGDQVQPLNYNTSILRTIGSPGLDAYWRFYSDGPAANNERAQFFSLAGQNHFNIHTPNGDLLWHTTGNLRMRLTQTLTNQNWAWYQNNNLDFSGHLGIGNPTPTQPLRTCISTLPH